MSQFDPSAVKAISFDVTGTIMVHREPIMKTYADAAVWAQLPNPPTEAELKPAFKAAYKGELVKEVVVLWWPPISPPQLPESLLASPCFGGGGETRNTRKWWTSTVKKALALCETPRQYTDAEFDRFFRRVYQH